MKHRRRVQGGFTLLELLMVVIIIAILASIALPQYLKTTEKARMAEAISGLSTIRQSQQRYRAENGGVFGTPIGVLDVENPSTSPGANYDYAVSCTNATTPSFVATATRKAGNAALPSATLCPTPAYVVTIDQAGNFTGRDCQSVAVPACI